MTHDEILALFRETNALLEGHFQLTSGLHSPNYFQCARVMQYPRNAELLSGTIARRFRDEAVGVVIAPALGGMVVGQEVARQLSVRSMFTERKEGIMQLRRGFGLAAGERVIVCEDVITTGGSVKEVIDIVRERSAIIVGVAAIVDRSGGKATLPNFFAAMKMEIVTYQPDNCPLCRAGVPIDKPGSRAGSPERTT